jgi:hypothetical protein
VEVGENMTSRSKKDKGPDPKSLTFPTSDQIQRKGTGPFPPKFKHGDRIRINDFDFKVLKVKSNRVVLKPIGFSLTE